MSGPASWRSTSNRTADLDLLPCLLLILSADLARGLAEQPEFIGWERDGHWGRSRLHVVRR